MNANCGRLAAAALSLGLLVTPLGHAEDSSSANAAASNVPIRVAILLFDGVQVLDVAGPLEVFSGTWIRDGGKARDAFETYLVAEELRPAKASAAGPVFVPQYTLESAPQPQILIVPGGDTSAAVKNRRLVEWIRSRSDQTKLTASVCTGAFLLAEAGLLKGKPATTHWFELDRLAREFPDIFVKRDVRYVESEHLMTSAGVSAGIDMSLRIVERYFGREVAVRTVQFMQYEGDGWLR